MKRHLSLVVCVLASLVLLCPVPAARAACEPSFAAPAIVADMNAAAPATTNARPFGIAPGDFDEDGVLDLVVSRVPDGRVYFLEVAARVGGAYIAETLEAASGINLWREWANIEIAGEQGQYVLPPTRQDYAGIALALARQEWPDTSGFTDVEIAYRVDKRHHVGLVVRSPRHDRVQELLRQYVERIEHDFLAVLPPRQKAE